MDSNSKRNFILQQGFDEPRRESCSTQFTALTFQPKVVAVALILGIVFQSPWIFFALSVALWAGALLPRLNPFDALYNVTAGAMRLTPAPGPRRFAQGMAATLSAAIGVLLYLERNTPAYVIEAFFFAAVAALSFGRFCFGSFVFHLLRGRASFAIRTLPWKRER